MGAEASTKYRTASRPRQNSSFSGAVNDLVERRNLRSVWTIATQPYAEAHFATFPEALVEPCILAGSKVEDVVLDPFTGSGTTLAVALRYQRNAIGIELSQPYSELIRRRVGAEGPLLHLVEIVPAGERYIPEPIVS